MKKVIVSLFILILAIALPISSQGIYDLNVSLTRRFSISYISLGFEYFRQLSIGKSHSLAVTTNGRVNAWGLNSNGQLGDGTTTLRNTPTLITFSGLQGGETIESVNVGFSHSFAVTTNGRVYAWGRNLFGQLGNGTTTDRISPTLITFTGLQIGETIESVNAGDSHSLAVTTNGRVYAWGRNSSTQLGDGTTIDRTTPTLITFSLSGLQDGETIKSVNAGSDHSLAVTTNGRVYAWGLNGNGQLGDGTIIQRYRPTLIAFTGLESGETIQSIDGGFYYSLGVTSNGKVFAWGRNQFGQLGDGTIIQRNSPTLIAFTDLQIGETIESVNTGSNHSFAVTTNGRVYAWGRNQFGQLGNGTITDRINPTLITFTGLQIGESIQTISAGDFHSLSLTTNGRVYAWGSNGNGRLGDGTTSNKVNPFLLNNTPLVMSQVPNFLTVTFNQLINLPDPVLEGYVFEGWYMDEGLTTPFNLTVMPANDLLLYAKFTPIASQG